jgi:transcriptional regulator with XRE-family HTH domain
MCNLPLRILRLTAPCDATQSGHIRNESQIKSDRIRNGDELNAAIASRITQLVAGSGLRPADFARQLGIDKSNMGRLLKGETAWTPKHLEAVAAALGVHPRELLPEAGEGPPGARTPNPPPLSLTDAEAALVLAVRAGNLRLVGHYVAELAPEPPPPRKPSPP